MFKYLYRAVCLFAVVFYSCNTADSRRKTSQAGEGIEQYALFISALDTTNVKSVSTATAQYRKLFFSARKDSCDAAFMLFEGCWQFHAQRLTRLVRQDTALYARLVALDEYGTQVEATGALKQFNDQLQENGYRVVLINDVLTVERNWNFAVARFSRFVTAEMTEYMNQKSRENAERYRQRIMIKPAPEKMIDGLVWREKFNERYTGTLLRNTIKEEQRVLLSELIINRTDAAWFSAACNWLEKQYAGTATHKIIAPYYRAIQQHNTQVAEALLDRYYKQGYITAARL